MKHLIARHSFGAAETTSPRSGGLGGRFFAAALLCIGLASCTSDDNANGDDGRTELRLTSGLAVQQVSRAQTDVLDSQFDKGDQIDVFLYEDANTATTTYGTDGKLDGKLVYTANGSGGLTTTETQYWPASGNGVNIYAFYPSGTVTSRDKDVEFTVKTAQNTSTDEADASDKDKNYKASDLMYGAPDENPVSRTSDAVALQFKHLLSKVTVTLKLGSGMTEAQLKGADVQLLSVKPTTTLTPKTLELGTASGTAQTITVIDNGTTETDDNGNYVVKGSCIVPPQTLTTEKFVKVELASGGVFLGGIGSVPTLESGNEYKYEITVNLTGLTITSTISAWNEKTGSGEAEMLSLEETLKLKAKDNVIDLGKLTESTTVSGCATLTGETSYSITIANGAYVILKDASISTSSGSAIKCSGNATIYLEGTNVAKSTDYNKCGIEAGGTGYTLTIEGSGSLEATGGDYAAGIGSGYKSTCGNITINGGTVTAKGGNYGAGIGTGDTNSSCGDITISGGTVTATGGDSGAGIGSGYSKSSCGNITISGGEVTATGGYYGAGIGSGYSSSSCKNIEISGGTVTAKGGKWGAGIGSGYCTSCQNIEISGGTVTANGGEDAAGIGSGYGSSSSCGTITITSGVEKVTVTKGTNAPNYIGAGDRGTCGTIKIDEAAKEKIVDENDKKISL